MKTQNSIIGRTRVDDPVHFLVSEGSLWFLLLLKKIIFFSPAEKGDGLSYDLFVWFIHMGHYLVYYVIDLYGGFYDLFGNGPGV